MFFGKNFDSKDRVLNQMLGNLTLDQEVSLKTLVGHDHMVMNLRPTDKSKFIENTETSKNDKQRHKR